MDNPVFNPNIPLVHSISGFELEKIGFLKFSTEVKKGTQTIETTYKRGHQVITYDGTHWVQNGEQIQFLEDIKN